MVRSTLLLVALCFVYAAAEDYTVLVDITLPFGGGGEEEVTGLGDIVMGVHTPGSFSFFSVGAYATRELLDFTSASSPTNNPTRTHSNNLANMAEASGVAVVRPYATELTRTPNSISFALPNVNSNRSAVSFVSHIRGSPDFFIGGNNINLRSDGMWRDRVSYELLAYDNGYYMTSTMTPPFVAYPPMPSDPADVDEDTTYGTQTVSESTAGMFALEIGVRPVGVIEFYRTAVGPVVQSISTQVSIQGGDLVRVEGYGFGPTISDGVQRSVSIGGSPCEVVTTDGVPHAGPFHIECRNGPKVLEPGEDAPSMSGDTVVDVTVTIDGVTSAPLVDAATYYDPSQMEGPVTDYNSASSAAVSFALVAVCAFFSM